MWYVWTEGTWWPMYDKMQGMLDEASQEVVSASGKRKGKQNWKPRLWLACPDDVDGSHYELTMVGRTWGWQERFHTAKGKLTKRTWFQWWPEWEPEPPLWWAEGAVALG